MLTRSCPRCRGYLYTNRDIYGGYRECLQCGYMEDTPSSGDNGVERCASCHSYRIKGQVEWERERGEVDECPGKPSYPWEV